MKKKKEKAKAPRKSRALDDPNSIERSRRAFDFRTRASIRSIS
jgi:hypothetical protein